MLSGQEIENLTGIPKRTVISWWNKGLIPRSEDPKVVIAGIINYYKQQIQSAREKKSEEDELYQEKVRLTRAQADKVQIEIAEIEGELVRSLEVSRLWVEMIMACRAKLLGLPSQVAPILAPISNPSEIEAMLTERVFEALTELGGEDFVERLRTVGESNEGVFASSEADDLPVG